MTDNNSPGTRNSKRIVVKVGSQVLCNEIGELNLPVLAGIARQVAALIADQWQVLVVSSGAVAAGAAAAVSGIQQLGDPVVRKQVLAATGQVELMRAWRQYFGESGLPVAQVLASRSDFQTRRHYLNMRSCIDALLNVGMIPIVNENDVVSVTELMFTDNDELAGLMAGMIDADLLCLLSSVPGVFNGDPDKPGTEPIKVWDEAAFQAEQVVQQALSSLGRGGMHSKLNVARNTARLGTEVIIACGTEDDILLKLAAGKSVGTRFRAGSAPSPAKRWLASAQGFASATAHINAGAAEALLDSNRLASLLPVGIDRLEGKFERGDVIQIRGPDNVVIACGRAQYGDEQAQDMLGQQGHKPLVHYDYLFIV